jgi:hypothetical protein
MKLVIAATIAFLLALVFNQVETVVLAATAEHPVIPHWLDQRYLYLAAWGFPVLADTPVTPVGVRRRSSDLHALVFCGRISC